MTPACEICWDDAFRLSRTLGGSQVDRYHQLLKATDHTLDEQETYVTDRDSVDHPDGRQPT